LRWLAFDDARRRVHAGTLMREYAARVSALARELRAIERRSWTNASAHTAGSSRAYALRHADERSRAAYGDLSRDTDLSRNDDDMTRAESTSPPVRVYLIDQQSIARAALRHWLGHSGRFAVVGASGDIHAAIGEMRALRPDVVLLDLVLPGVLEAQAVDLVLRALPDLSVVIVTHRADAASVRSAMSRGARAFVSKDADELELLRELESACAGTTSASRAFPFPTPVRASAEARTPDGSLTSSTLRVTESVMSESKKPKVHSMKRILVAVDAEGFSDHAVRAGCELGRALDAKVELLHVVGSPALDWEYVESVREASQESGLLSAATRSMQRHVKSLLADPKYGQVRVEDLVRVLPGHPARVILREAERTAADFVVLGMHRRKGFVDFGGTARQVLAGAPRSVWMQKQAFAPIRTILAPVDLSPESMSALASACSLASAFRARVRAIHCFQGAGMLVAAWPEYPDFGSAYALDEARAASRTEFEHAMRAFDWRGVEHESDFLDGDPVRKILDLSSSVDLVVMGTHGRTGLASAVLGNVAYSVMKHIEKPVLAIRHAERDRGA
jgi:nucleotide-binding universal stress UspA family protein/DNA-binding NarL/FixJ family response regulator